MTTKSETPTVEEKLCKLASVWRWHQDEHRATVARWIEAAEAEGLGEVAEELRRANQSAGETMQCFEKAEARLREGVGNAPQPPAAPMNPGGQPTAGRQPTDAPVLPLRPIGVIRTPYTDSSPYQPVADDPGEFQIHLDPAYREGLEQLERFRYVYLLYYAHKVEAETSMAFWPPWLPDTRVGIFASRAPSRPNRIGLSVVRLLRIEGAVVHTSGLDVFDGTPLLDIKPYIRDLDVKTDANYGWLEDIEDRSHLMLHIRGIPHDY